MAITAQEMLDEAKIRLIRTSETLVGSTPQIRAALKTLSMSGYFLEAEAQDLIASLAAGNYQITLPTDFAYLHRLYVYTENEAEPDPLKPLIGGYPPNTANGTPIKWRQFNGNLEFYPPANGAYFKRIEYGKLHPDAITTILFDDKFREALYCLATRNIAAKYGITGTMKTQHDLWLVQLDILKQFEPVEIETIEYTDL